MNINARAGVLLHIGSVHESEICANLMQATMIYHTHELAYHTGTRVLVDLDTVTEDEAISIGEQYREHGVKLIVTARPETPIPHRLAVNLTGAEHPTAHAA